jgi:beta-galactosidase
VRILVRGAAELGRGSGTTSGIANVEVGLAADGVDVIMVEVWIVDKDGLVVPTANNVVTFAVTGRGVLRGGGNGDPADHTPTNSSIRPAFNGAVMGVVGGVANEPGAIYIHASSIGLEAASVLVESR